MEIKIKMLSLHRTMRIWNQLTRFGVWNSFGVRNILLIINPIELIVKDHHNEI